VIFRSILLRADLADNRSDFVRGEEVSMRMLAWTMLAIGTMLASQAEAQTYDPRYPVCVQTYSRDGSAMRCNYSSMA
jgi:hypothetical protein